MLKENNTISEVEAANGTGIQIKDNDHANEELQDVSHETQDVSGNLNFAEESVDVARAQSLIQRRCKQARKSHKLYLSGSPGSSLFRLSLRSIPGEVFQTFKMFASRMPRRDRGILAKARETKKDPAKTGLQELWACHNEISEVPPEIKLLRHLHVLALTNNKLEYLAEDICALQYLERLLLGRNLINSIPKQIVDLQNLRELRLNNNRLQLFPVGITLLPRLQQLSLSHNAIKVVPPELRRLVRLIDLDLDNNRIESMSLASEKSLLSLDGHLRFLGLANNYFSREPACIAKMVNLKVFRFSGNRGKDYEVVNEITKEVIPGINIPRRYDGVLQLKEGVMKMDEEGKEKYIIRELEGYCASSADYNRSNARWHQREDCLEAKILKTRAMRKRWKTKNRLEGRNKFLSLHKSYTSKF